MSRAQGAFEREYFERSYRDYDRQNPPRKLDHYRQAVERHVIAHGTVRLLDIGCAFGAFLASLDSRWEIYGADVSEYAIGLARQRLPRAHLEPVRNGELPFAEHFDIITAFDVLEHIPNVEAVVRQVVEHLTDDGAFLFVVPVYDGPLGPMVRALDADVTHIHRLARRFWLDLARRYFEVEDWWGLFRSLVPGGYYVHWPSRALRGITPAIAVVGRRKAV
jgi:SAM-dependent methyltransferase